MLGRIRHIGALLTAYAGKVGRTAKLIGTWLTASADLLENLADLWGADGNNLHSKGQTSIEQIAARAGASPHRKSEGQASVGEQRSGAVHSGTRVLDSGTGVRGIQTEVEAPKKGGQDDANGATDHGRAHEIDTIGATAS